MALELASERRPITRARVRAPCRELARGAFGWLANSVATADRRRRRDTGDRGGEHDATTATEPRSSPATSAVIDGNRRAGSGSQARSITARNQRGPFVRAPDSSSSADANAY